MLALLFDAITKAAIAVAGFAGLRESEITGLHWGDYDGDSIKVQRSIDRTDGRVNETKSQTSAGAVPVIAQLRRLLEQYKATQSLGPDGQPLPDAPVFPGVRQQYGDLDKMALRTIRPVLQAAGIKWCGWRGFRRGLATNLHQLGVPLLTIQAICRHSDPGVTEKSYVKRLPKQSRDAMSELEAEIEKVGLEVGSETGLVR